nr:uncharacterized protein F54H12.2-like [Parasteatoda tepidariorum]
MDDNAAVGLKSELDLFSATPFQLAIDDSSFLEVHPVASLNDNSSTIEWYVGASGENYLDLGHSIIHMQVSIKKKTGVDIGNTDHVAPINYFLNTMFSECSVFLNDKQVSSQVNYAYRAIFESLLLSSKSSQNSMLTSALFFKDTAGKHDEVKDDSTNAGFKSRQVASSLSKTMDLIGPLHFDLGMQPKLLINGVSLRIKMERNKDIFSLMSENDSYQCKVHSAKLYIRKIIVSPSIVLAHEKALEKGNIKMPIRRTDVKSFTLSNGLASITIANAFIGQIPSRLVMGFVSNDAYNGKINKNPFNFKHNNLAYLTVLNSGKMFPAKAYQPNFETDNYARSYLSLFTDLSRYHNHQNINISFSEFKNGYTLYAFDLTPDFASGESHNSTTKNGNIAIDIKFSSPLEDTQNLVVYAVYNNCIEIDKSRTVFTDY